MAKNIYGGGAQTNANGLLFEQETDLKSAILSIDGYSISGNRVLYNNEYVGIIAAKHKLYTVILEPRNIDYKQLISKKLLPDEGLYIDSIRTMFIVEKKFQNTSGSVDEKLQTCAFKLQQYKKLFSPLGIDVKYLYVLNDWFKKEQYQDVL